MINFFKSLDSVMLIDPSNRATDWLKKHMSKNKLEVISQQVEFLKFTTEYLNMNEYELVIFFFAKFRTRISVVNSSWPFDSAKHS